MNSIKIKFTYNLVGTVLPLFIAVIVIPILIKKIGVERFGILAIAWMLIGYFGLLDMGLGRALTHKVAKSIGACSTTSLHDMVWKTVQVTGLLGLIGTIVVISSSHYLVYELFKISDEYLLETYSGLFWLSLAIPLSIMGTAMFGTLEGQQHFGYVALIKAPTGSLMFFAPLIVTLWTYSIEWVLFSLFIVRLIIWIVLFLVLRKTLLIYKKNKAEFKIGELKSLFSYGGWVSVSSIISPVMVYFDRFYIAIVLSASVVAYYTTPFDMLIKVLVIPFALVGVMFAVFSNDWEKSSSVVIDRYRKTILFVLAIMTPFALLNYYLAEWIITIWLGSEFAFNSYQIAQIIGFGIFLNALSSVPFSLIQGVGRADVTAKIHLFELPVYIFLLWFFVNNHGLIGAAYAWVIRVGIDCIVLYISANYLIKLRRKII